MNRFAFVAVLFLFTTSSYAQRGGRIGFISGVAKTQLNNSNDLAVSDSLLLFLPTHRWHNGVEAAYFGKHFGISGQIMLAPIGQNYRSESANMNAKSNINYLRSALLFNFTTKQKKQVRLTACLGLGHGINIGSRDVVQFINPNNDSLHTLLIKNTSWTYDDSVTVKSTLSESIYHPYDMSLVAGIGLDFRINSNWLMSTNFRYEKGLVGIDNNRKTTRSTYNKETNTTSTENYDHWGYLRAKFIPDYANKIRALTYTQSMGLYLSFKYLIVSQNVKQYELYE